jgi:hypothetical protein
MTEPDLLARQRSLLQDLRQRNARRAETEPALQEGIRTRRAELHKHYHQACQALDMQALTEQDELQRRRDQAHTEAQEHFDAEQEEALAHFTRDQNAQTAREEAEREEVRTTYQEACWTAAAVLEGVKGDAEKVFNDNRLRLGQRMDELAALRQTAHTLLAEWKHPAPPLEQLARAEAAAAPRTELRKLSECLSDAHLQIAQLQDLVVPRFLKGKRLLGLSLLLWLVLVFPLGWLLVRLTGMETSLALLLGLGLAASTGVTLIVGPLAYMIFTALARRQIRATYLPFGRTLIDAEATRLHLLDHYESEHRQQVRAGKKKHNQDVRRAHAVYRRRRNDCKQKYGQEKTRLEDRYQQELAASEERRDQSLQAADQTCEEERKASEERRLAERQRLDDRYQLQTREAEERYQSDWAELCSNWLDAMSRLRREADDVARQVGRLYPPWTDPAWQHWKPPAAPPELLRLGGYEVHLDQLPGGLPQDDQLRSATPALLPLPAVCGFPEQSSLLLQAKDSGRARAVEMLQAVMYRLLAALPPGKVRFVVLDPVGLGQNFASFMHLADYDEALITSRIWTETAHIERQLADLTAHMENVIQKYLRNRYPSITAYNAEAGEVAEPFRVLVAANFPVNFTPEAARRLLSIAQSGPRCGVMTLVSVDVKQAMPEGFDLADLAASCLTLEWDEERFRWRDPDFAPYPLRLDPPPADEFGDRLLTDVGTAAKNAQRVEVPFEYIAPPAEQWWTSSTRPGIDVPLGRAGATRRQMLQLGHGTAQHVLVAGKTGSGKSTLLHALITNLALCYSPDEIELYLIDFKKGVEFKTYAVHHLPHARVIAIESEREFGLSVLQRLDAELKQRADRFRAARAQDLGAYRQAEPDSRMPRILLVVDEFQEFFVEDDRIAQESAQLLDRLVRQGRAFGMHVLLGSQTLGGAYSLARSTIDQMAVRIALQCSEADAHLILSDDNSAARLLSRPGEAIYNDANGRIEGNNPFQVVWLNDERRETYLERVRTLASQRPLQQRSGTVVFEGNAPADVSQNHFLERLLATPPATEDSAVQRAWLGEAMSIDELTAAVFRPQNGSNLLVLGQQEETIVGLLATAVLGLAAHMPADDSINPRFYVLDGRQAATPTTGVLARLGEILPQRLQLGGSRDIPAVMAALSAELERRQKEGTAGAPVYLVLHALHRMRDLRRAEDDFSFTRSEEKVGPAQQFATLLREGAALGIHVLVWCDTLANLQRAVERSALREFGQRVLFQMNVADSSQLIDSPAASKLGMHRALYFSEDEGRLDKFRPYGRPADPWLEHVERQFRGQREGAGNGVSSAAGTNDRASSGTLFEQDGLS